MKRVLKILSMMIFFAGVLSVNEVIAQEESKLDMFLREGLTHTDGFDKSEVHYRYEDLIGHLIEKQTKYKTDGAFLEYTFYYIHRKFLGEYEQYVSFGELFSADKKYDCVTGTTLYSLILDELGYNYEIRETDYHVYLMVYVDDREYMYESTDAIYGFVSDPDEIQQRRDFVLSDAKAINEELALSGVASDQASEQKVTVINNSVSLKQMVGLNYYNQALREFNKADYRHAYKLIAKAQGVYPSTRIKNAASFMFATAFED